MSRAGQALTLPRGKPQELVELVAASGGRIAVVDAIEALWPESTAESGRRGMRNALNRLRRTTGEVLIRDHDTVRLPATTRVDLLDFQRGARDALGEGPDVASIERALALHGGELLATRREPWVGIPRERTRELLLSLLDLHAELVEAGGELGRALESIERAISADPLAERRYLIAARILAAQGRQGTASRTLARGTEAISGAGLAVPPAFAKLAEAIGVGSEHLRTP